MVVHVYDKVRRDSARFVAMIVILRSQFRDGVKEEDVR